MKKWVLMILGLLMMLVLAVPAMAQTGEPDAAQNAGTVSVPYTVEFTYEGKQYVMPGDSSVRLGTVLDEVGLTGEAEAVAVSDESLFSASNATGEWIVTVHQAFDTEEWMKVTINSVVYEITVTDDQIDGITVIQPTGGTVSYTSLTNSVFLLYNTPNTGYSFERYIVTDANGNEISLDDSVDYQSGETLKKFTKTTTTVTVTAVFKLANHTITVTQPATGGTVRADMTAADEGDRVNLSYTEQSGYLFRNFVVTKASGGTVEVTNSSHVENVYNWGFNMPAEAVTVTAVFAVLHAINVQQPNDGPINVASSAMQGDSVTININPKSGYTVKNLTVKTEGGTVVHVTRLTDYWSFTMPDSPVTVSVECEAKTYTVRFDRNAEDATGTMEPQSFTYGEVEKALTANAYTRKGYDFAGWNTVKAPCAGNAGTAYVDRQSVQNLTYENNGTVTLYAQWTHVHSFSYALSDNRTITATCQKDVCSLTNKQATLTINAPTSLTYDGSEKSATITDDNSIQGAAKVQYQKKTGGSYGTVTETAPIDVGDYKASITLGNATASVEYSITIPYPVWVGGVQVTSANKDDVLGNADEGATVMYTPANGSTPATLTLNGANIMSGHTFEYSSTPAAAAIYAEGDLTIDVTGDSTVTCPDASTSYGVRVVDGKVTITGSGTLTATGGMAKTESNGVYARAVTVDVNGTLNAKGGTAERSNGVYAYEGAITVNGTLNAEGGTANYFSYGVYAYEGAITVNGTLNAKGATAGNSSGVYADEVAITVTGTLNAEGNTKAIYGAVRNFIDGTGWTNTAGTEGKAYIAIKNDGQTLSYKKVQFLAHVHSFTYSANEATITATCTNTDGYCALLPSTEGGNDHIATLTIGAPALTTYGGTGSAEATITDANYIQGDAKVQYQKKTDGSYGTATETAPTEAGDYKASITLGEGNGAATASMEYTIAKADPTANAPTGLTATFGQTLADVSLNGKNPTGNTQGAWAWADSTQNVGNVVTPAATFKANFTPSDTSNYNSKTDVDVAVIVSKANATTEMQAAAVSIEARNGETATVSYTLPDGASYGTATNENTEFFTVSAVNGLIVTIAKDSTASEWATDAPKTFTIPVTGATNYKDYTLTVSVTPTYHQHSFSYSVNGTTITATCEDTSCDLHSSPATLTLSAADATYTGSAYTGASLSDTTAWTGAGLTAPTIEYVGCGDTSYTKSETAPTNAGNYMASITVGTEKTATANFTISKADPGTPNVAMNGYTYGGTVSTPSIGTYSGGGAVTYFYNTTDSASGGTAWSNITATTLNANTYYMYAVIAESDNYNSYSTATASFTVSKADQTAPDAPTKAGATINSITLTAIENGEYKMDSGEWQASPIFTGLTMNKSYTFRQRYAADENHNVSVGSNETVIRTNNHSHEWGYEAQGATITATCSNTDGGHTGELTAQITVVKPEKTVYGDSNSAEATITGSIDGVTNPPIVYKKGSETLNATPTNAGTYTANITLGEGEGAKTAYVEYTIGPMALTITGATATDRAYDKNSTEVTISAVTFKDSSQQAVALTPGEDKDYTVTGAMTDANAGDGKTVNVSVTLKNANYSLATSTTTATVNIGKAAAQTIADVTDTLLYTATSVFETVAGKMPADAGELTYTTGNASTTGSVTVSDFTVNATNGAVTATFSDGAVGNTVTLPVTISSTNYANSTANVVITLTAKGDAGLSISGAPTSAKAYGDTDFTLTGSVTNAGTGTGEWTWSASDPAVFQITPNGATATVKILKAGSATITAQYESDTTVGTETTAAITVNKNTLTITAKNQNIFVGGTVPTLEGTDFYTVTGFVGEETLTTQPTLKYQKNNADETPDNTTPGSYDIVPSGAAASDNYTISYTNGTLTISEKPPATVTRAPEAKTLTYIGRAQALVSAGEATGGEIQYALGTKDAATEPYTTSIPTATNAGTYYVWYKVIGNASAGYSDSDPICIPVTIAEAKANYSYVSGAQGTWQKESGRGLSFHITNSGNDEQTFSKFTGIQVDGKPVDKNKYEAKQGSVIINLKPIYLETLSIGEHKLKVVFDDGNAETSFTIIGAGISAGNLPQTGDAQNPLLYAVIALISVAGIGLFRKRMK